MAVQLVLLVHACPGLVGSYAQSLLDSAASSQGTEERWRDALPLPVSSGLASLVGGILKHKEFKLKKAGMSGGAIKAAHRRVGIDCLMYCMIVGLNLLWSGLKKGARIPSNATSSHQNLVLDRLRHAAAYMVEGLDGAGKGGVPRTPTEGWTEKLRTARISYHGEVVAKAEPLVLDRILASLPPEGFGGAVNILDVCEGEVRALLSDPERCLLPDNELPKVFPRPQVRVAPGEWEKIARALYERGIVAPTEYIINVEEVAVTNGLFGVEKTGRDLPDGRCAQRLIMDLRGSNSILKQIAGDVQTLSGACAFTTVVLDDNQIISISGDDLVSSFYLFRLPACWLPYPAFERPKTRALGVDKEGDTFLGASVLPMGFNSSVGIMQHIHRRLALWNPLEGAGLLDNLEIRKDREWPDLDQETPVWCLYLDDSTFLRRLEMQVMESVVGRPGPEQEQMRKAYQFWGIPFNLKKAIAECEQAERLGAYLDGRKGRIGVTVKRYLECLSLGFWILSQGQTSRKSLQIYAGKEVHCLQFRRPLFSVYDEVWRLIAGPSDNPKLTEKFCMEVVVSMSLSALRFTDWRAAIDPYVMASDASERGGGFCMAKRLSGKGLQAVRSGVERREGARSGIVVFDFFAGIGGFMRSLERAGLVWEHHVIVEKDKQCRRLLRRTWGGASEYPDITKITKEDLARELDRVPMLTLVGGSPCQGLSRLLANRLHFDDDRSKLFYDFGDRLGDLQDLCKERNARFLGLVENVVMDESDRDEISMKLGWYPYLLESSDISRVRRPRFYWLLRDLPQAPWFEIFRHETAVKVRMFGDPEPTALWLPEGWTWQAESEATCFPTFTRPIVRRRPPPSPAGLSGASRVAKERWEEDQFRYPPYTYIWGQVPPNIGKWRVVQAACSFAGGPDGVPAGSHQETWPRTVQEGFARGWGGHPPGSNWEQFPHFDCSAHFGHYIVSHGCPSQMPRTRRVTGNVADGVWRENDSRYSCRNRQWAVRMWGNSWILWVGGSSESPRGPSERPWWGSPQRTPHESPRPHFPEEGGNARVWHPAWYVGGVSIGGHSSHFHRPLQVGMERVQGFQVEEGRAYKLPWIEGSPPLHTMACSTHQVSQLSYNAADRQPIYHCGHCKGPLIFQGHQPPVAAFGSPVLLLELIPAGCLGWHGRQPSRPCLKALWWWSVKSPNSNAVMNGWSLANWKIWLSNLEPCKSTISTSIGSWIGPCRMNSVSQTLCRLTPLLLSSLKLSGVTALAGQKLPTRLPLYNSWFPLCGMHYRCPGDLWKPGRNMNCQQGPFL